MAADGPRQLNEARSFARVFGFYPVTNGESLKGFELRTNGPGVTFKQL